MSSAEIKLYEDASDEDIDIVWRCSNASMHLIKKLPTIKDKELLKDTKKYYESIVSMIDLVIEAKKDG